MRPLPTSPESLPTESPEEELVPTGRVLDLGASNSNQRRAICPTQRSYPWLLGISTIMAGAFCFLYINKPVIVTESAIEISPTLAASPAAMPKAERKKASKSESPMSNTLPGDHGPRVRATEPRNLSSNGSNFEETNLRIQHILGAQSTEGDDLGRVILDVPVLYQSGAVRWTQEDVTKARSLLTRIGSYQERSRALREEAVTLISEWDDLIVTSIPEGALRADSPTLPENQGIGAAQEALLNTTESIEIENP
ncbi:hypothetical protein [Haloferula sp.]|uniref:hypothetical protein n=1 Tax=Haloferula sp. TaxID=2497595 RepID=UPI00329F785C